MTVKQQIVDLCLQPKSMRELAKTLGIGTSAVCHHLSALRKEPLYITMKRNGIKDGTAWIATYRTIKYPYVEPPPNESRPTGFIQLPKPACPLIANWMGYNKPNLTGEAKTVNGIDNIIWNTPPSKSKFCGIPSSLDI